MTGKNENQDDFIKAKVMEAINSGEVKIKSKAYYVFTAALVTLVIISLIFLAAYFFSLIALWFRLSIANGPAYGIKFKITELVNSFPYWALGIGLISLIGLIFIIKRYGLLYKIRLIYLVISTVILIALIGFVLSFSQLSNLFNNHRRFNQDNPSAYVHSNVRLLRARLLK